MNRYAIPIEHAKRAGTPAGPRPLRAQHARLRGLAGEESRLVPHQDNAPACRVGRHADQLPALPGARVYSLLEIRHREAIRSGGQLDVLRVVTIRLRSARRRAFLLRCTAPLRAFFSHDSP